MAKKGEKFQVVPYDPSHEEALLQLERMSPQGFLVKLETIRDNFLSRAILFEDYEAYTVMEQQAGPVAASIGARVPIRINGMQYNAGYGCDLLVHPAYRNRGIGQELSKYVTENFLKPKGLTPQFTILRVVNVAMLKLLSISHRNTYLHEFIYLTFPTAKPLRVEATDLPAPHFQVGLLSCQDKLQDYYELTASGLGLWHTYKIYQLKVKSVSPVVSGGMWLGSRLIRINKYVPLPGAIIRTVTVFNLNPSNIATLPEVALELYKQGVNYMQVCCQPNDATYRALHKSALNTYSHYIVSTQEMNDPDDLCVDVRCL